MRPPTTIETARLVLRLPVLDDAETIFKLYAQDEQVTRYLTWKPHPSLETTRAMINQVLADWNQDARFAWVISRKENCELLGMIALRLNRFEANLGYVLARAFWGQGIMTETVRALIDWALVQPEIYRVWAICDRENIGSARVMEKTGMQREGLMRRGVIHPNVSTEPRDCWLYAKTR